MRHAVRALRALRALLPLLACSCSGQAPEHARPATTGNAASAPAERAAPAPSTAPSATATPTCREPLSLVLTSQVTAAGVGLSLINRGASEVRLAAEVALVPAGVPAGSSQPEQAAALRLQHTCAEEPCVSLAPGGELMAPRWLGARDGERCGSLARPAQAGSFELVVRACDCSDSQRLAVSWPPP